MIHPYFNLTGSDARGLLYGLMEVDKIQLRESPGMPSMRHLVQSGKVKYRRADPEEHWQSYKEIVGNVRRDGVAYADCEDIASAIAAEDQVKYGVVSLPYAYTPKQGLFHVVTAVPVDQFGAIPRHDWPGARFAPDVPGYVLQDPSVVAGMGSSFEGLPGKEVSTMSSFGRAEEPARRRRGLGGLFRSFSRGLLGGTRAEDVAQQLGTGAREGTGIQQDWAQQLGRSLPGALGLPGSAAADEDAPPGGEEAAVASLREGMDAERASPEEDLAYEEDLDADLLAEEEYGFMPRSTLFGRMWFEDDPDFDFDDEDEEFGFSQEDLVGSWAWHSESLGNRVADDMFGAVDDSFDYTAGLFQRDLEGSIEDAELAVGSRGHNFSHLRRPGFMEPPSHLQRPVVTYGDMEEDADEDFGAFWHSKDKRQANKRKRFEKKLRKLKEKGKEDSPRFERLVEKYVAAGGDEDDVEDFGYLSSKHLFGGDDELDDELLDLEAAELEDLELSLTAEGY